MWGVNTKTSGATVVKADTKTAQPAVIKSAEIIARIDNLSKNVPDSSEIMAGALRDLKGFIERSNFTKIQEKINAINKKLHLYGDVNDRIFVTNVKSAISDVEKLISTREAAMRAAAAAISTTAPPVTTPPLSARAPKLDPYKTMEGAEPTTAAAPIEITRLSKEQTEAKAAANSLGLSAAGLEKDLSAPAIFVAKQHLVNLINKLQALNASAPKDSKEFAGWAESLLSEVNAHSKKIVEIESRLPKTTPDGLRTGLSDLTAVAKEVVGITNASAAAVAAKEEAEFAAFTAGLRSGTRELETAEPLPSTNITDRLAASAELYDADELDDKAQQIAGEIDGMIESLSEVDEKGSVELRTKLTALRTTIVNNQYKDIPNKISAIETVQSRATNVVLNDLLVKIESELHAPAVATTKANIKTSPPKPTAPISNASFANVYGAPIPITKSRVATTAAASQSSAIEEAVPYVSLTNPTTSGRSRATSFMTPPSGTPVRRPADPKHRAAKSAVISSTAPVTAATTEAALKTFQKDIKDIHLNFSPTAAEIQKTADSLEALKTQMLDYQKQAPKNDPLLSSIRNTLTDANTRLTFITKGLKPTNPLVILAANNEAVLRQLPRPPSPTPAITTATATAAAVPPPITDSKTAVASKVDTTVIIRKIDNLIGVFAEESKDASQLIKLKTAITNGQREDIRRITNEIPNAESDELITDLTTSVNDHLAALEQLDKQEAERATAAAAPADTKSLDIKKEFDDLCRKINNNLETIAKATSAIATKKLSAEMSAKLTGPTENTATQIAQKIFHSNKLTTPAEATQKLKQELEKKPSGDDTAKFYLKLFEELESTRTSLLNNVIDFDGATSLADTLKNIGDNAKPFERAIKKAQTVSRDSKELVTKPPADLMSAYSNRIKELEDARADLLTALQNPSHTSITKLDVLIADARKTERAMYIAKIDEGLEKLNSIAKQTTLPEALQLAAKAAKEARDNSKSSTVDLISKYQDMVKKHDAFVLEKPLNAVIQTQDAKNTSSAKEKLQQVVNQAQILLTEFDTNSLGKDVNNMARRYMTMEMREKVNQSIQQFLVGKDHDGKPKQYTDTELQNAATYIADRCKKTQVELGLVKAAGLDEQPKRQALYDHIVNELAKIKNPDAKSAAEIDKKKTEIFERLLGEKATKPYKLAAQAANIHVKQLPGLKDQNKKIIDDLKVHVLEQTKSVYTKPVDETATAPKHQTTKSADISSAAAADTKKHHTTQSMFAGGSAKKMLGTLSAATPTVTVKGGAGPSAASSPIAPWLKLHNEAVSALETRITTLQDTENTAVIADLKRARDMVKNAANFDTQVINDMCRTLDEHGATIQRNFALQKMLKELSACKDQIGMHPKALKLNTAITNLVTGFGVSDKSKQSYESTVKAALTELDSKQPASDALHSKYLDIVRANKDHLQALVPPEKTAAATPAANTPVAKAADTAAVSTTSTPINTGPS